MFPPRKLFKIYKYGPNPNGQWVLMILGGNYGPIHVQSFKAAIWTAERLVSLGLVS